MKKNIVILTIVMLGVAFMWKFMTEAPGVPNKLKARLEEGELRPDHPEEGVAYWAKRLVTPNGESPNAMNLKAKAQVTLRKNKMGSTLVPFSIESMGPGNFGGRVRSLLIHPQNPQRMLTAGVSGGVSASDDGGLTWTSQSDFISNLAVSCMAYDPDHPETVYLGTGEGFYNLDAMQGFGIFKSSDFGKTWEFLAATGNDDFIFVNRLAVLPGSGVVLAATRQGIFRSENGGNTWTKANAGTALGRGYVDLKVDPSDPQVILAYNYGSSSLNEYIARSSDGGNTFEKMNALNGLPSSNFGRMEIGWGTDGTVYIAVSSLNDDTLGLWKSVDHGQSFEKTISPTGFIERQGWYDLVVGVDPSDSNRVYLGAVDLYRSLDGGATIEQISFWSPDADQLENYVHADLHAIAFDPTNPSTFVIGSDGGLFKSVDGGDHFVTLNNDLRLAQNYGLAVHPDGSRVITGNQDNGSHLYFGDKATWLEWAGGDGGFCAWDQQDGNYLYGATPNGGLFGSSTMGANIEAINLPDTNSAPFVTPFVLDPNDGNRMLVGTDNVFYSSDVRNLGTATWKDVSGHLGTMYSLAFDPSNSLRAYAADDQGGFYKTDDLETGTEFQKITDFNGIVTCIAFDSSGSTQYVTLSGYRTDRVLRSQDGGNQWTSIHGDLPNIPVHALTVDPLDETHLFAGTELGLFSGTPSGDSYHWEIFDYGVAWTRIVKLIWGDNNHLWVATHGRGVYRLDRNPVSWGFAFEEIAGDGDVFLDAGESHLLKLELKNTTSSSLVGGSIRLFDHDSGVSILNGTRTLSVAAGDSTVMEFEMSLDQIKSSPLPIEIQGEIEWGGVVHPITIPLTLCANAIPESGVLGFESGSVSPWETQAEYGDTNWDIDPAFAHGGSYSLSALEDDWVSLKTVVSPEIFLGENPELTFYLAYNLEENWDGLVLEGQVEGGTWFDLADKIVENPYTGGTNYNNPLFFRRAWTGTQLDWQKVVVDLGSYAGKSLRVRFRLGSDSAFALDNGGAWIDDFEVQDGIWNFAQEPDTDMCSSCVLEPTALSQVYYLPFVQSGAGTHSKLYVTNAWQEGAVELEVVGFKSDGSIVGKVGKSVPRLGALQENLELLFGAKADLVAWVQVGADAPVDVVVDIYDDQTHSAYLGSKGVANPLFVPHIAKQISQFETHLVSVNGSADPSELSFIDAQGLSSSITSKLDPWSQNHVLARDILGDQISSVSWGTLNTDVNNLASMEFFTNPQVHSRIASLGLNQDGGTLLRFLHLAFDTQQFWTGMVYFNASDSVLDAVETYYDAQGGVLANKDVTLQPGEKHTVLFDYQTLPETVPEGASWMEVNGNATMVGYELFGSSALSSNDYFAGLQGSYHQGTELEFQVFFASQQFWTGLVAINVGDEPSALTLTAYNANGDALESTTTEAAVSPKNKVIMLSNNLFSESTRNQTAWVLVHAEASQWDGFSLWGDHDKPERKFLAGVRAAIR